MALDFGYCPLLQGVKPLKCRDVRTRLEEFALGGMSDLEHRAIENHIRICEDCAEQFAVISSCMQRFKDTAEATAVSTEFTRRLDEAICGELESSATKAFRPAGKTSTGRQIPWRIAALLALAISGIIGMLHVVGPLGSEPGYVQAARVGSLLSKYDHAWEYDGVRAVQAGIASAPVARNGHVFAVEEQRGANRIIAVDADGGKVLWRSSETADGYLVADNQHVYAVTRSSSRAPGLLAMRISDGTVEWNYSSEPIKNSRSSVSPSVYEGIVYWANGSSVVAVDSRTGKTVWNADLKGKMLSRPVPTHSGVYVASEERMYRLARASGDIEWDAAYPENISGMFRPLTAHTRGRLYVAHRRKNAAGMILCLDDRDGEVQWRKNDLGTYHMLARNGILYTRSHMVQAFGGEDGESIWTRHAAGCSPLQFAHDCLIYTEAGAEKAVVALNAQTGDIAGRLDVANSCTGILLAEGMGFISSNDGVLRALRVTS